MPGRSQLRLAEEGAAVLASVRGAVVAIGAADDERVPGVFLLVVMMMMMISSSSPLLNTMNIKLAPTPATVGL